MWDKFCANCDSVSNQLTPSTNNGVYIPHTEAFYSIYLEDRSTTVNTSRGIMTMATAPMTKPKPKTKPTTPKPKPRP